MKNPIKTLSIAALMIAAPFAANAEAAFKSAGFGFSGQELLQEITPQSLSADAEVLYCRADISVSGKAERAACYLDSNARALLVETESALKSLPFTVAEVEGKAVPVRMSFRVAFSPVNDQVHVSLLPNLGTMQAQYGRDYVAPQERLDVSDWYERYSSNSWIQGQEFLGAGDMARVSTTVTESGKPSNIKTLEASRAHERDADIVKRTLKYSRFLPGTANGKVVPMDYLVAVHYGDRNQAVADR